MIDFPIKNAWLWKISDHIESDCFLFDGKEESKMEIYKEKVREGRPLVLKLQESDGHIYVVVVDKEGKVVSWLLRFDENNGLLNNTHAKVRLDDCGYDTSSFKWGDQGELLISGTR